MNKDPQILIFTNVMAFPEAWDNVSGQAGPKIHQLKHEQNHREHDQETGVS